MALKIYLMGALQNSKENSFFFEWMVEILHYVSLQKSCASYTPDLDAYIDASKRNVLSQDATTTVLKI